MLVVETILKIRRLSRVQGKTIKAICRELGISRKVVRKVLRSDETEFKYERTRQPQPKLGPWRDQLDGMLLANAAKSSRERLTLIRLFEDLRDLGYEGGYDTVRRYARTWAKELGSVTAEAYVPLYYAPGEAYQFDWSHEIVVLNGVTTTVKVAHVRLCHSRMMYVRAYPRETQEMVFDAHDRAFAFFGGACTRGIYDNLWTPPGREEHLAATRHWMRESIRPIAGAITLLALMGVRYLCPHNMIDLYGLVVNQDPKLRSVPLRHQFLPRIHHCLIGNDWQMTIVRRIAPVV